MAANFIPLIIAAGAVGYLATKDTKKKDKVGCCTSRREIRKDRGPLRGGQLLRSTASA